MTTDFVSLIATLEEGGHPFVLYRYPEEDKIHVLIDGTQDLKVVKNPDTDHGFVFAPFSPQVPSVLLSPTVHTCISMHDLPLAEDDEKSSLVIGKEEMMVQKHEYLSLVKKAIREIDESHIQKIVTSRVVDIPYTYIDTAGIYTCMCHSYPMAMVYYFSHPHIGKWMGASPELLVLRRNDILHTMSLAGTKPYVGETTYRWSEKEVEEQSIVTKYICDTLSSHGIQNIQTKGPENHRAGTVVHLCTSISGYIKEDISIKSLLETLSPTPALCGYPKDMAMSFLSTHEKHHRTFYGGYMGEINMVGDKSSELYVNLRCMQINDNSLRLYVGGGITHDSDPESEWEETCHKLETMMRVISPYVYIEKR